jgi:hypothetical protein
MTDLPAVCPDHPVGMVRHTWIEHAVEFRTPGPQVHLGWTEAHQWECAICGRQLAEPRKSAPGA